MRILVYGAKSYDVDSFKAEQTHYPSLELEFTETGLNPFTACLANGYDAVCAFVNDNLSAMTLDILAGCDIKLVLMRKTPSLCAIPMLNC